MEDIVEIGSAREVKESASSTEYFFNLSRDLNKVFWSVDLSESSFRKAAEITVDRAVKSDGAIFLRNYRRWSANKISILYLDNYDVVYNESHLSSLLSRVGDVYATYYDCIISNEKSAEVHLEQAEASLSVLAKTCLVCIDDTKLLPSRLYWGKGARAVPYFLQNGFSVVTSGADGLLLGRAIEINS